MSTATRTLTRLHVFENWCRLDVRIGRLKMLMHD
jgi:hypothetical protein